MEKSEYTGFFASFYDRLHADSDDVRHYPGILLPYGKRVLEIGCGTGRIAVPLANAGFAVTGLENEEEMLAILHAKDYPKERLTVVRGDARSFHMDEAFDSVLLGCNFVNHFVDSGELLQVLRCCHAQLRPGGLLLIDCSLPDLEYMHASNGVAELFKFPTEQGTVIHDSFCPNYDFANQIETDIISLKEYRDDELVREADTVMTLTFYMPRELRSLLREAGFTIIKESGELGCDVPIGQRYSAMVFYATRG